MIHWNFKKIIFASAAFFFFLIFSAVLFTAYLYNRAPVEILLTHYPIVKVTSPEGDFEVSLNKNKPKSWTSIKDITSIAVSAIVVSEDWAFYDHEGVDYFQLRTAIWESIFEGKELRGASSISQQTIKNIFLDNERSLWRKFVELIYTIKLENNLPKDKILEIYLNIVEFDKAVFGIKHASMHYFGKFPHELNAREGAFLAMLLPSPKKYSVSFKEHKLSDYARETIDEILVKLRQAKYYTEEDRLEAMKTKYFWED